MEKPVQLRRDCQPSAVPLKNSYYHGTCDEPLISETIGDVLDEAAGENPDHVVFRTNEFQEQITLIELKRRAGELSKALQASGLQRGDIVLLVGITDIEFFVLYFAITQIGLVFLYPELDEPVEKDTTIYCNMKPAAIFIGRQHSPASISVIDDFVQNHKIPGSGSVSVVLVNASIPNRNYIDYNNFLHLGKTIPDIDFLSRRRKVSIDDVAVLFVSSGTSSNEKKTSCATHHIIVNVAKFGHVRMCPHMSNEVIGVLNPVIDDAVCLLQLVRTVLNKVVCVLGSPSITPTPDATESFMSYVEKEKITWYSGMPFELIFAMKSQSRNKYDLSSLRGGGLLGQVTKPQTKAQLAKLFPESATLFGATEAFAGFATSIVYSTPEQRLSTVGYGFPHCEIKLVDSNNVIVPIGEQGEICIRGWTVFKEYLNDQQLTSQAKDLSKNGWYHYGDIGIMDGSGHVTYIGRKADCVRYKHFSDVVYPAQILSVIESNDKIQNAKTKRGLYYHRKGTFRYAPRQTSGKYAARLLFCL
ncbi:uncharacterized protein LOC123552450 isoform X2 [Mercenaria mercenaria]|uniref:uncharacterized protein LOC123552450 isoform X2 n=1 Tax=Mercenaria mercenaria TaxID=6596 RepID=UPI00234EC787|nr:uncharacterized protein LOC123552450 isoform X2 [Mercenaria mercenaria]